jgi:hypothetical protein
VISSLLTTGYAHGIIVAPRDGRCREAPDEGNGIVTDPLTTARKVAKLEGSAAIWSMPRKGCLKTWVRENEGSKRRERREHHA